MLFIEAFDTDTELSTLYASFEAKTIFLLALRLLTGAEDEILHAGLFAEHLLHVMHVFAITLSK